MSDEKLKAFCEGLEMQNIPELITRTAEELRLLGKAMAKRIKNLAEPTLHERLLQAHLDNANEDTATKDAEIERASKRIDELENALRWARSALSTSPEKGQLALAREVIDKTLAKARTGKNSD